MVKSAMKFLAVIASGCSKGGCTDKTALNYDPTAVNENDFKCFYIGDSLIGNYNGPDTCYGLEFGTDSFKYSYGFMGIDISKGEYSLLNVTSPTLHYLYGHTWKVDAIPFTIIDAKNFPPDTMYGNFNLRGDTLYYHIVISDDTLVQKLWGYGVRQ